MNERILIVDDEPSIHEVARAYLERDGFIVYSASDGREGLELALTKRPTLIVQRSLRPRLDDDDLLHPDARDRDRSRRDRRRRRRVHLRRGHVHRHDGDDDAHDVRQRKQAVRSQR
ncbi:MAG: hypothetical protein ACHQC8_04215 [Solirubrobacterales bacterium]